MDWLQWDGAKWTGYIGTGAKWTGYIGKGAKWTGYSGAKAKWIRESRTENRKTYRRKGKGHGLVPHRKGLNPHETCMFRQFLVPTWFKKSVFLKDTTVVILSTLHYYNLQQYLR